MEAYAARIRAEADADAQALRAQAAGELAGAVERATVEARASVQAEDEQRRQLSGELEQLAARRDAAREELRKIAGALSDAVGADEAPVPKAPDDGAAQARLGAGRRAAASARGLNDSGRRGGHGRSSRSGAP